MLATALSATLVGLESQAVRVEVDASRGVPHFELVGLAEAAVRESRVRVKSALSQVGVDTCESRIVVNLAPADLRKNGTGFDVAIAAATMAALRSVPPGSLDDLLLLGELSLTAAVHPVRGVLPQLLGARQRGVRRAIVPAQNGAEAALVDGLDVRTIATLEDLVLALRGKRNLEPAMPLTRGMVNLDSHPEDLQEVRGQPSARRALEIAAAGGHNLLLVGPPGSGKTMLARRLPGLMPKLSVHEALEVMAIHSVAGLLRSDATLVEQRPFRAPHHTVSEVALVGGGDGARPGEVSLAHQGVLFLDELAEFRRSALEALRQPIEDGVVSISRAQVKATYPARPLLVGAMNPCPCGYQGDGTERCRCPPERIRVYRNRLSGPLLDRIDMHVILPPVSVAAMFEASAGEGTVQVRDRVVRARNAQRERCHAGRTSAPTNGALRPRDLEHVATLDVRGAELISKAVSRMGLSARAYGKVLRLARTIADLEISPSIKGVHVAEAIGFRLFDRALSPV